MKNNRPNRMGWFFAGLVLGGTAAYIFDPDRGRRRRAILMDKFEKYMRESMKLMERNLQDMANRLKGTLIEIDKKLRAEPPPDDDLLTKRIRAQMGRYVTHSRYIDVQVENGIVTLSGPILTREVDDFVRMVKRTHGTKEVINHLDVFPSSDQFPNLQAQGKEYLKH